LHLLLYICTYDGSSGYYHDPSSGKYFVEIPLEEDDDDFVQ